MSAGGRQVAVVGVVGVVALWLFAGGAVGPGVVLPLVVVVGVGLLVGSFVHRRRVEEAYARLVASADWSATTTPLGRDDETWATTRSLPRGDRRCRAERAVVGPQVLVLAGREVAAELSVFTWTWETRSTDSEGRSSYRSHATVVAAARLAMACPPIAVGDESLLTSWGIGGRSDLQVESDAFNRRFRVDVVPSERPTAVRLLDAAFQRTMLEQFDGRELEWFGDVVLLGGRPRRRDPALFGDLGWYPAARDDLLDLLDAVPHGFWRAVLAGSSAGG